MRKTKKTGKTGNNKAEKSLQNPTIEKQNLLVFISFNCFIR